MITDAADAAFVACALCAEAVYVINVSVCLQFDSAPGYQYLSGSQRWGPFLFGDVVPHTVGGGIDGRIVHNCTMKDGVLLRAPMALFELRTPRDMLEKARREHQRSRPWRRPISRRPSRIRRVAASALSVVAFALTYGGNVLSDNYP